MPFRRLPSCRVFAYSVSSDAMIDNQGGGPGHGHRGQGALLVDAERPQANGERSHGGGFRRGGYRGVGKRAENHPLWRGAYDDSIVSNGFSGIRINGVGSTPISMTVGGQSEEGPGSLPAARSVSIASISFASVTWIVALSAAASTSAASNRSR